MSTQFKEPGVPFGLMLHHFDDGTCGRAQGAISAETLDRMIEFLGADRFLRADEWCDLAGRGTLPENAMCLTFDDALRCQIDVALPVMEARGLTGFWFVYSSVFQGGVSKLEVYRHFRTDTFESIDDFYAAFDDAVLRSPLGDRARGMLSDFVPEKYLSAYAIYTDNDRKFRFLRDQVLGPEAYEAIMDRMIEESALDISEIRDLLWMDDGDLKNLAGKGHEIGLHSYSHPTNLAEMSPAGQADEYRRNFDHLSQAIGRPPRTMSHPCNSYNEDTLKILRDLGIDMGFRSNLESGHDSMLELPREDHAIINLSMAS